MRHLTILTVFLAGAAWGQQTKPRDATWVGSRILEIQPTADERKFDTIGWVPSVKEALRLAKEQQRPVLLFTYDGQMHTGRC